MATLILPHSIESFTPADAVEVDQNYLRIAEWINTQMVGRDGSNTMTGHLTLFSNPEQPMHAVPKQYIDALIPVGTIWPYGGLTSPGGGWITCNGQELAIAEYPDLYAVLQGRYGAATTGTFKVPALQGRVIIGMQPNVERFNESGKTGGTWLAPVSQHKHSMAHNHPAGTTANETQNHQHPIDHNHASQQSGSGGVHAHSGEFKELMPGTFGAGGGYAAVRTTEAASVSASVTNDSIEHTHTVDIANYDGNSFSQTARHNHTFDVANFTGDTANTGTANAEHLPPYLVLYYIIKAKKTP